MEQRCEQLHPVGDTRSRPTEMRRGVHHECASGADRPRRDASQRRRVVIRLVTGTGKVESAGHDEQHVRVESGKLRPGHGIRGATGGAAQRDGAGEPDHFGHPVAWDERRLEPLECEDPRCGPAGYQRANGRDAPLDLAHAFLGAPRHPARASDCADRVEHARDVVGVEREHRRAGSEPEGGRLGIPRRHRAHLAHALGQDQIGLRRGQALGIDFVHAAKSPQRVAHGGVDLPAR